MLLPHHARRTLLLASFLLAAGHVPAQAAGSTFLQTINTSTGPGTITIEGFSKPDFPGRLAPQSPVIVMIGAGSTPPASTVLIRDAINAAGYAGFVASIPPACPDIVRIDFPGTFSMSIVENVPGQQYLEVPDPASVPTLSEWGIILLSLLLVSLGAWHLHTRQRNTAPGLAG